MGVINNYTDTVTIHRKALQKKYFICCVWNRRCLNDVRSVLMLLRLIKTLQKRVVWAPSRPLSTPAVLEELRAVTSGVEPVPGRHSAPFTRG